MISTDQPTDAAEDVGMPEDVIIDGIDGRRLILSPIAVGVIVRRFHPRVSDEDDTLRWLMNSARPGTGCAASSTRSTPPRTSWPSWTATTPAGLSDALEGRPGRRTSGPSEKAAPAGAATPNRGPG